jgi:hypothetical protein
LEPVFSVGAAPKMYVRGSQAAGRELRESLEMAVEEDGEDI